MMAHDAKSELAYLKITIIARVYKNGNFSTDLAISNAPFGNRDLPYEVLRAIGENKQLRVLDNYPYRKIA